MKNQLPIQIEGVMYKPMHPQVYSQCYDAFDIMKSLKPMEYAPYYDKYIYKLNDNTCRATYQEDVTNNWSI